MTTRIYSKLDAGVYRVAIHTQDWSELDRGLMTRYSEPTIDLGGAFTSTDGYTEFELSNRIVRIMSESPFTQGFDARDYGNAEAMAEVWKTTVFERLQAAIQELRARADTFTREEVVTI